MDKSTKITELSPSYSHSSCVSSKLRSDGGFLFDDYARDMPQVPIAQDWQVRSRNDLKFKSPLFIAICLSIILFLVQLGASLTDVPTTRLLEDVICKKLFHDGLAAMLPEEKCQGLNVQAELNVLSMGALILGYLPGILVAVPYGILSDKFGRKSVLALSVLGMVISQLLWAVVAWNWRRWDLRFTWTSSAALLIGGGQSMAQGMVFAMITDIAPQNKREIYFNIEMCAIMLGQAAAPFIAAAMMTYSIWLPLLAAPAILTVGGLLIPFIPYTLEMKRYNELREKKPGFAEQYFLRSLPRQTSSFDPWATPWSRTRNTVQRSVSFLKTRDVKLLLPCASLVVPVVTAAMNIILRYIPVRFGWTLAKAGMLLGTQTALTILVLVFLLPALGGLWSETRKDKRDLIMARGSITLLVAGLVTLAAGTNVIVPAVGLAVMTLGSAAPALCRASLVRLAIDKRHSIGQVFGVLAICETLGYMVCTIGLGALYQWCIHSAHLGSGVAQDAGWLTLALYAAALVLFVCGAMASIVNADDFLQDEELDADDEDIADIFGRLSLSEGQERYKHEPQIMADFRIARNGPCLESVTLAA